MKIAIASGKGGTGKTFVSTNLYWSLHQAGISVTLVDCDAEEPNVGEFLSAPETDRQTITQQIPVIDTEKCTFCGKCHEYCNYNAIVILPPVKFIQVVDELCHDCGACYVACQEGAIAHKDRNLGTVTRQEIDHRTHLVEARAEVGVYSPVPLIKKAINSVEPGSLAILDSPPGISCPFIATVDRADYVVLVTEPTPFGLNDLKLSVETLREMGIPCGVIINRAGLGDQGVQEYLVKNNIPLLMEIPFDKEIARIYSEGGLWVEKVPEAQNRFLTLLETIKKQLNS